MSALIFVHRACTSFSQTSASDFSPSIMAIAVRDFASLTSIALRSTDSNSAGQPTLSHTATIPSRTDSSTAWAPHSQRPSPSVSLFLQ